MTRSDRIPFAGGWEWDAFTRWRKVMSWRAGALAYVKRGYRRRARRAAAAEIRREAAL